MNSRNQQPLKDISIKSNNASPYILILHNDDHNTFEFVTESLINICEHEPCQAEQCAFLAHYKGKCEIKVGGHKEMNRMKLALREKGLTVTITKK